MSITLKEGDKVVTFCECHGCSGLFHQGEGNYSLVQVDEHFYCKHCLREETPPERE